MSDIKSLLIINQVTSHKNNIKNEDHLVIQIWAFERTRA